MIGRGKVDCRNCGGDGYTINAPTCPACGGAGQVRPRPLPRRRVATGGTVTGSGATSVDAAALVAGRHPEISGLQVIGRDGDRFTFRAIGTVELAPSPDRFEVLGGPGGRLAALAVGDSRRHDRYRAYVTLARVNRPMSPMLVQAAYGWALRTFEVR